ncbi:MAG: twin-arginine translocase subunit TatC [Pelagimonas sp.]|uniref:twin-arginine translocase subunit TatC n=1 Tax=Pelagimonas sp. TaxID=2073170 RepID=UPI003D6BEFC3
MSATENEIEDSAAPLIEHLAELRTRLIRSVIALVIGIVVVFPFAEPILKFLVIPVEQVLREMGDIAPELQTTSPTEALFAYFRISMVFGFALAFPVIGYQLWRFVAPGLFKTEKNAFLPFLLASPIMFLLGASFAQFVITPMAMGFLLGFSDVATLASGALATVAEFIPSLADAVPSPEDGISIKFNGKVSETLDITLKLIMAFGLCFQLPVLLTLMGKAGLVSAEGLGSVRKYAMLGILVLAALVTPPDVVTQLILFSVVYGLYEISIFLVRMVEKKREADLRAQGLWFEEEDEEGDDPLMAEFDEDDVEDTKDTTK